MAEYELTVPWKALAPDAERYAINRHFIYTLNDRWAAGLRLEWLRDDDVGIMGVGNHPDARGWSGAPGHAGRFANPSLCLNRKPKPDVLFRPEVCWDWYDAPQRGGATSPAVRCRQRPRPVRAGGRNAGDFLKPAKTGRSMPLLDRASGKSIMGGGLAS